MRELSREYLNVPEWYYIGIEAGDMLRSMVSNAQGVEDALSSFRETIAPYGGYSFASRLDDVDRMERAAQAMVNCRKYLSEEFDELIDAPLKRRFNYMMDELATIDVNDFKVRNTLGIEGVAYVGKEDREEIRELPNLTLEDFVGSNLNEFDNSRLRHIEKVEGISKIFEESYGYLMEGGILDESLSLKEYLKQYVPEEFYYKRDSSVPQKVLQSSWEGLKVTQLIDIIRGKEMFTGDHLTDEEKGYKVVIGTVDTALTAFGVGLVAKPGSGAFCKGIVIASVQDMGINATYTMMNETGFEDWAKAVSLGMTALSLYSIYRYGKAYRNGNKGNVPESKVPKETVNESVINEGGTSTQGYSDFADGMSPEDAARYITNNEKAFFNEFSERASAVGLNNTQIAEAFEAMRAGDYAKMATYFDTSSPIDGAVFWSGNKEGAAAYASSIGGTIMEQTPGGQVFDNWRGLQGMYPEWDAGTALDQKPIWNALSAQYAEGAVGNVTYVHIMRDGKPYYGAVWKDIEKKILLQNMLNGKVTNILEVIIDAK